MFVEHKEVGEVIEAPTKTMKPSQAIRAGLAINPHEQRLSFSYCALGAMWRGYGRTERELAAIRDDPNRPIGTIPELMADAMGIDQRLAREINTRHFRGEPAISIAADLEARGR